MLSIFNINSCCCYFSRPSQNWYCIWLSGCLVSLAKSEVLLNVLLSLPTWRRRQFYQPNRVADDNFNGGANTDCHQDDASVGSKGLHVSSQVILLSTFCDIVEHFFQGLLVSLATFQATIAAVSLANNPLLCIQCIVIFR
jgi:hypothetical protein